VSERLHIALSKTTCTLSEIDAHVVYSGIMSITVPTVREPLTNDKRASLKQAARDADWEGVITGVLTSQFETPEDKTAEEILLAACTSNYLAEDFERWQEVYALLNTDQLGQNTLISSYCNHFIAKHHQTWNKRIGGFAVALGIVKPSHEGEGVLLEESMTADGWEPGHPYEESAYFNGSSNVRNALKKNYNLNAKYTAELAGVGWREAYHAIIAAVGVADPEYLLQCLTNAPALPGDIGAPQRRSEVFERLVRTAGSREALGQNFDGDAVAQCWKTYSALTKTGLGKDPRPVDAVTIATALMGGASASGKDWLVVQVSAIRGRKCSQCGNTEGSLVALFDKSVEAAILSKGLPGDKLKQTMDKAKKSAINYQLYCSDCSFNH
jgi:hypothetical protein